MYFYHNCYRNRTQPGVVLGDDVTKVFQDAKTVGYAIPAVNCTSSSTVNAALEAAQKAKSPIICQFSNGGAAFYAGKGIDNKNQEASILGMLAFPSCSEFPFGLLELERAQQHFTMASIHSLSAASQAPSLVRIMCTPWLSTMASSPWPTLTTAPRSYSRGCTA
jgi:hypothetical protein